MSAPFDPYYTWLGIAPTEQPADYYRLLGVQRFEANADAIQSAMDQRMHFLRTLQVGPRSALSQSLLNEVAHVGACLLNSSDKAVYDRKLRAELAQREATQQAASPVIPVLQVAPVIEPPQVSLAAPIVSRTTSPARPSSQFAGVNWMANWGLAVIAVFALLVCVFAGIGIARWASPSREPVAKMRPGVTPNDDSSKGSSDSATIQAGSSNNQSKPIVPTAETASPPGATSAAIAADSSNVEPSPPTKLVAPPMPDDPPPFFVAGEPVNLIQPETQIRHLRGSVNRGKGIIRTDMKSTAFGIPVKWLEEYAIEADVTRLTGKNSLCFGFLVHGRPLTAIIDGFDSQVSGLARIGGFEIFSQESPFARKRALLTNGVKSTVRIEVTRESVALVVDDKLISHWTIDPQLPISAAQGMNWLENEALCIYTWDASYRFERLELLPLVRNE